MKLKRHPQRRLVFIHRSDVPKLPLLSPKHNCHLYFAIGFFFFVLAIQFPCFLFRWSHQEKQCLFIRDRINIVRLSILYVWVPTSQLCWGLLSYTVYSDVDFCVQRSGYSPDVGVWSSISSLYITEKLFFHHLWLVKKRTDQPMAKVNIWSKSGGPKGAREGQRSRRRKEHVQRLWGGTRRICHKISRRE